MKSIYPRMNRKVCDVMHQLDPELAKARPVTFWFYTDSGADGWQRIQRLAAHLQVNGYRIITCNRSRSGEYLCIGEKIMQPDNETINRLCIDMHILAEKMKVTFDRWETELSVDPEETRERNT